MSMKNILILVDFSDNSWNSIEYTLALFQNKRCNFYLLNVKKGNHELMDELVSDNLLVAKKKNQKEKFDKLLVKISKSPLKGEHIFTSILADKDIIKSTRHQIEEKKIDLVVIGTNGMSSDGRKNNISPTSEDIITKLKCSILVVPNEAKFSKLKEIAFPTDYTNFHEAKLLQNISSLLSFHEFPINFVHVTKKAEILNREQKWNKETLEDYFANQPHSFHAQVNPNFEQSIEDFIDKKGIDLIVMAAKNLNLFEQILFRPKLKNIKYYFKTPFLVLHQFNY